MREVRKDWLTVRGRSTTWARWLGWTALYAVLLYVGVLDVFEVLPDWMPGDRASVWRLFLVPPFVAFVIGVRFRSWSWGLGPLVAAIAPLVLAYIVWGLRGGFPSRMGGWALFFLVSVAGIGGMSALAALAGVRLGVWWEERQEGSAV